jgi:type IV pilus assembly protein PilW
MSFVARRSKQHPHPQSKLRTQKGLTLIELLIALALGLAVLIGLSSVYVAVKQSFRFQETSGRLQEDGAFALDAIAKDLRMAGYAGCAGINKVTVGAASTYYPGSVITTASANTVGSSNPLSQLTGASAEVTQQPLTSQNFIRGFTGIPSTMFASSAPVNTSTDSLFFSGGSSNAISVSSTMAFATSTLILATDTYNWRNDTTNTFIVANCVSSSTFIGQVSVNAGGGYKIAHDTTLNNSADTFTSSTLFGTDTIVMPLEWNFYYVDTRSGATTPSLYRVFFNGKTRSAAQEVVSNVESMRLHYGESNVDGAGVSTLQADNWRTSAADVTDWSRVVAVRVGLMMVSSEDNANPEVTLPTPTLLGAAYTKPAGASANRLRKEFSTTVVLRNTVTAR